MTGAQGGKAVVAFGFRRASDATVAELELRQLLDASDGDLWVREGRDGARFGEEYAATVAWRVREGGIRTVLEVVGRHGGDVLEGAPPSFWERAALRARRRRS
jgi:hypothetical protein